MELIDSVPHGKEFVLSNGRVLKSLYELSNELVVMEDSVFEHHVTSDRNDFSNWILHVYKNETLAKDIAKVKTKDTIASKISKALSDLTKKKDAEKKKVERKKRVAKILPKKEKKAEKKPAKKEEPVVEQPKVEEVKEEPVHHVKEENKVIAKLDEVLERERELSRREQKIQEIEERIEQDLHELGKKRTTEAKFFSREFVQGLIAGFLITLIGTLLYIKYAF